MIRAATVVTASIVALIAATAVAPPASATTFSDASLGSSSASTFSYVSLGASFAAGAGVPPQDPGAPAGCSRSLANFSHLIAAKKGYDLRDMSCGGAQVRNLTTSQTTGQPPQFDALTGDTDLVTLLIGYNDSSVYTDSLNSCAEQQSGGISSDVVTCQDRNGTRFSDAIRDTTGPAVAAAITGIKDRAPDARIIVVGYPAIFPQQGNCPPQNPYSTADTAYLNGIEQDLNTMLDSTASEAGVEFVDTFTTSIPYNSCQSPVSRWIEPRTGAIGAATQHPNARGELGIAGLVLSRIEA